MLLLLCVICLLQACHLESNVLTQSFSPGKGGRQESDACRTAGVSGGWGTVSLRMLQPRMHTRHTCAGTLTIPDTVEAEPSASPEVVLVSVQRGAGEIKPCASG